MKIAFKQTLKPKYQKLLQREVDPAGDRGYTIVLLLPNREHIELLTQYLRKRSCPFDGGWQWQQHYLPNLKNLMNKVSFHASGFPWVNKEDQKLIPYETYNKSHRIMEHTFQMRVSWYFEKQMMIWMARKVNDGLDEILATCSASDTDFTACYA